jgi:hypothetical protein
VHVYVACDNEEPVQESALVLFSDDAKQQCTVLQVTCGASPYDHHTCRQKRDQIPDGRRVNRWFLSDPNEELHLAVQGEERDARYGRFYYTSRDPFASIKPMGTCTNQQQVMHWLENFITHHAKAGMHVGDHIRSVSNPPYVAHVFLSLLDPCAIVNAKKPKNTPA